jgi:transposase-like protein
MQTLTPVQTQVLAGLLAGQPVAAVAREHGIHRSTIYAWRRDHPHFSQALDQTRSALQAALFDEVQDLASQALEVLGELLRSEDSNVKLRAAQAILRAAPPFRPAPEAESGRPPAEFPNEPKSDTMRHFSTQKTSTRKTGRNELCPCNSGLKYKKCCGNPARPANPTAGIGSGEQRTPPSRDGADSTAGTVTPPLSPAA